MCLGGCTGSVASVTACRIACKKNVAAPLEGPSARYLACQGAACGDPCALTCGGHLHDSASCESCGLASCCPEATDCATSDACISALSCLAACAPSDGPCRLGCTSQSGAAVAEPFLECMAARCGACGDPQWSCLGSVSHPEPVGPTVRWEVFVVGFVTITPVEGALVRHCGGDDSGCAAAGDPLPTDARGVVALDIPAGSDGFLEISGADLVETLVFPSGATTVDRGVLALVFRPEELTAAGAADLTRAQLVVTAESCLFKPAIGVSFDAPGSGAFRYWRAGEFVVEMATDASGAAALLDVRVVGDPLLVEAEVFSTGTRIQSRDVVLRAGALTVVGFAPVP